jgi:hypothetical protein
MTPIARRECLSLVGKMGAAGLVLSKPVVAAAQLADRSEVQRRIGDVIHGRSIGGSIIYG